MFTKARASVLTCGVAAFALMLMAAVRPAHAITVDLALTPSGTTGDNVSLFTGDLGSIGLTSLSSITLIDSNSGSGGNSGQFSGFDLDAVFLEDSGGNQINPTSISFTAGALRGGGVGPTFGASSATSVDDAVATLSLFDADDGVPDLSTVNGFLSLGDGGILVLYFDPDLAISAGLKLVLGEVNTLGESLTVRVAQTPLPAALWMLLSGVICLCSVACWRRGQ